MEKSQAKRRGIWRGAQRLRAGLTRRVRVTERRKAHQVTHTFVVVESPRTKRSVIIVPHVAIHGVRLVQKKKWYALECDACGKRRSGVVLYLEEFAKKSALYHEWLDVTDAVWARDHGCRRSKKK